MKSIGCMKKLQSGIVAMGMRLWRIVCSQLANMGTNNK